PEASLQRLEQKFFQHTYVKDSESDRLERIEKMVFGETKTGSDQQRLDNLVQAIPAGESLPDADGSSTSSAPPATAETPTASPSTAPSRNTTTTTPTPRRTATKPTAPATPATPTVAPERHTAPAKVAAAPPPDSSKYPAVTAIENKVLGKAYE